MIIIDNFVQDQVLIDDIIHDKDFFGPNGDFMWWDGWWNNKAKTTKQKLIDYIWSDNCPLSKTLSIRGFEYWTGIQTSNTETYILL